jgi:hypothetical protein
LRGLYALFPKKKKKKKKISQGFGGLNLERVYDITHFEEILESLMHEEFLDFSLKFI